MSTGKDGPTSVRSRNVVVTALGLSQTLAWASSYYLPAILADPIGASIGVSRAWVFAAFSAALLIAAFAGPAVGRIIDRYGGRGVLVFSNIVFAVGLVALAGTVNTVMLFAAWAVLGIGMGLGLYDAAFAALAALYGHGARGPITGITLFAGFASTVSWPVSTFLNDTLGWRETVLVWALVNLLIGLPLNRFLLPVPLQPAHVSPKSGSRVGWHPRKEMLLLAFVFAAVWFVTGAMASQLPTLLERAGVTPLNAVAAASLVGPAQVAARLAEFVIMRKIHPLISARIAALLHPIGAVIFAIFGAPAAVAFTVYGGGNGLLTIARGTVPLAVFGPYAYGERTGLLGAPARASQAFAPLLFGLLLDRMGIWVIAISSALSLAALAALLCLHSARNNVEMAEESKTPQR